MKIILSLSLLPIMLLAQPHGQHQNIPFNIEFSMAFTMESTLNQENDFLERMDGTIQFFVTVEVTVRENEHITPQFFHNRAMANSIPKYLSTYFLTGLSPTAKEDQRPQGRLNRLLAMNDPMFPKEDTLLNRFHPVRYQFNKLGGAQNMPEGFGPRIRL